MATRACDLWCDTMVWEQRDNSDNGAICKYTYQLNHNQSSGDSGAEYIRNTVYQYSNGKLIKTVRQDLPLDGVIEFPLAHGCTNFRYEMQLRNRFGAHDNLHYNTQTIRTPPSVSANNVTLEYDATKTGNNLTYGLKGAWLDRNGPREGYKVTLIKEQSIDGTYSSSTAAFHSRVIGWDTNETQEWSNAIAATLPQSDNDWIKYTLTVEVLGWRTNPSSGAKTTKRYFIARPPIPTVTKFTKSTNGKGADVTVKYNLAYKDGVPSRPMDKLKLQINYAEDGETPKESAWTDIGEEQTAIVKSGDVTAGFYVADSAITPEQGQHVYLRAKASWQTLTPTYSKDFLVPDEYYYRKTFTYEDDADESLISILGDTVPTGDDNTSLVPVIGYSKDSAYNGCEIGYSIDKSAWMSTKQPETFEMPDSTWRTSTRYDTTHDYFSRIKISDLDEETTYFLRARRYNKNDDTTKSAWSVVKQGNTGGEELTGLVLTAGDIVATSKPCTFTWNFPDDLKQTDWFLKDADTQGVLATGTGSITSTTVIFAEAGDKNVYLTSYFDNGKSMDSDTVTVKVVEPPTVSFSTEPATTATTLPFTFSVVSDDESAQVQVVVKALGMQMRTPEGFAYQYKGDVVYSATGTGKGVDCSISNADAHKLWDGGVYTIYATATANGVSSEVLMKSFNVGLTDSVAIPADEDVVITPNDDKSATIQVNNLADGTTWDLYRVTNDMRNSLIMSDLSNGAIVTDMFAPFSTGNNCRYIVQVKNANRQFVFKEYAYTANYMVLRFDWNDTYVELPYNIEISDETDKQFEQQIYLDGTQRGAWGASVVRSASLSTDTVYIKDEEVQKKIRELARYQGAVFVRTPLGQAYTANVEVKDINKTYDKKAMAVSFDCTEIDLTSDFMAEKPTSEETTE